MPTPPGAIGSSSTYPFTTPNCVRIHSAVLLQYTFWSLDRQTDRQTDRPTHTQTDRWARRQVYTISAYTRYIDREQLTNNTDKPRELSLTLY